MCLIVLISDVQQKSKTQDGMFSRDKTSNALHLIHFILAILLFLGLIDNHTIQNVYCAQQLGVSVCELQTVVGIQDIHVLIHKVLGCNDGNEVIVPYEINYK